jgi:predicted GTPase
LQVKFAIEQSDLILFLVSTNDQIDSRDIYVSKLLKKYKSKKIILVNNKIDRKSSIFDNYLYNLGFGK